MNANGHSGLATTTAIGITTPNIARYALAGLLLGVLIAGGGIALLIRTSRQAQNRSSTLSRADSTATANAA